MRMTIAGAALAGLCLAAAPAAATPLYTFTDLGLLAGDFSSGQAAGNGGHVVGYAGTSPTSSLPRDAVVWQNGVLQSIGTLGGSRSTALGVNDQGDVVGWSRNAAEETRAISWSNGTMTDLTAQAGRPGWTLDFAWDINSAGQIVGVGDGPDGGRGWLLSGGQLFDLGTLGGSRSDAYGINEAGEVVGRARTADESTHAFYYSNGMMIDLGTLGGSTSQAQEINDFGQIAGWSTDADGDRLAFIWENGTIVALASLGGGFDQAWDINDAGQVVGQARDANGDARATLWIDDLVYDLNELLIGADGWTLDIAWGVNDLGWITGNARDADGNLHGFILTPVPEPASMTILACGGLALLLVAGGWRQRTARAA